MRESRVIGLAIAALGLLVLFILIPAGIVTPSNIDTLALAPAFWPSIIASVFVLMGFTLLVAPAKYDTPSSGEPTDRIARFVRLILLLGALFGVYASTPSLGLVVPSMLMVFGLSWLAGERRWKLLIMLSFASPIALAAFFTYIANIPIPLGVFEFIL